MSHRLLWFFPIFHVHVCFCVWVAFLRFHRKILGIFPFFFLLQTKETFFNPFFHFFPSFSCFFVWFACNLPCLGFYYTFSPYLYGFYWNCESFPWKKRFIPPFRFVSLIEWHSKWAFKSFFSLVECMIISVLHVLPQFFPFTLWMRFFRHLNNWILTLTGHYCRVHSIHTALYAVHRKYAHEW